MATRAILTPYSAEFPATNFPQLLKVNDRPALAYDAATDEAAYWTFIVPQGITGTMSVVISYIMASATTGNVRFEALVEAVTDGDSTDLDATTSFDSTNNAGSAVPGTAGFMKQLSITLTNNDTLAAADYIRIKINRDADGTTGTDDATGDCYVLAVEFKDAA